MLELSFIEMEKVSEGQFQGEDQKLPLSPTEIP